MSIVIHEEYNGATFIIRIEMRVDPVVDPSPYYFFIETSGFSAKGGWSSNAHKAFELAFDFFKPRFLPKNRLRELRDVTHAKLKALGY